MKNRLQHVLLGLVLALIITNVFAADNENCTIYCNTIGNMTFCQTVCY